MTVAFGQSDIVATLAPKRPGPGRKPVTRRVYGRYGRPRERLVQEICEAVARGGSCVYFAIAAAGGDIVVPVPEWKLPAAVGTNGSSGTLAPVADVLRTAAEHNLAVEVFSADRERWTLDLQNERNSAARDALDAEPDSDGNPTFVDNDRQGAGAMREEF